MKREIYITILLFTLMLIALAAAVQGQHSIASQYSSDTPQKSCDNYMEQTTFGAAALYDVIDIKPDMLAREIWLSFIPYRDKRPDNRRTSAVVFKLFKETV
ncbi:MAG TPA: hypothetical protein VIU13_05685 [Chryseolinea sp.]